jgi:hypothetical protein
VRRCTICRYLVCGADSASLYLSVLSVEGQDIICEAQNSAVMDGLMTVSCFAYEWCYLCCYFVTAAPQCLSLLCNCNHTQSSEEHLIVVDSCLHNALQLVHIC